MSLVFIVYSNCLEGDSYVLELFSSLEKARNYVLTNLVQYAEDNYKELAHMPNSWYNGTDTYSIKEHQVK